MAEVIHLLPDIVINQIAAGEVIQRPASVVKELMENSVDAGATSIEVFVKDAGKTLIQVTDNGCGMSPRDAASSLQRHATSKIHDARDLFAIRTMGFRGEALASIASIAQTEIRTKRTEDELGTMVFAEGGKVTKQEAVACRNGTTFTVKNLFYNVPARRKFLKSDQAETRHILDEFTRVSLVNPGISFALYHNDRMIYQLDPSKIIQRIVHIFGNAFSQRLVPLESIISNIAIKGYIGKPEFARKTRGEQFFFVNGRYIRYPYLHHAVESAYKELIPENTYPAYFIFFDVEPSIVDVNIHPTKTEVKFEDERLIYSILRAAVKQALGKFNLMPSIDFSLDANLIPPPLKKGDAIRVPSVKIDPDYNPFRHEQTAENIRKEKNLPHWEKLLDTKDDADVRRPDEQLNQIHMDELDPQAQTSDQNAFFQIHNRFIISPVKSGLMIIDQSKAHQRILYERFLERISRGTSASQKQLFPLTFELPSADSAVLTEILPELLQLGFDIREFGRNTFLVDGIPVELNDENPVSILENFIENYREGHTASLEERRQLIAKSMAAGASVKPGTLLHPREMSALIDDLFQCKVPELSPEGKPCLTILQLDELDNRFK